MANENEQTKPVEEQQTPPAPQAKASVDEFLEAAKQVKEGSVPKEDYEKAQEEIQKLTKFILDGKELPADKKAPTPSIAELQKIRHNPDATNLEVVSASLGIREQIIKQKGVDPFAMLDGEAEGGKKVAKALQEIVDEADGDSKKFNFLFEQALAEDDSKLMAALRKKRNAQI